MTTFRKLGVAAMVCGIGLLPAVLSTAAHADTLMGKRPWGFRQEVSRASIAALMMQREQQQSNGLGAYGYGGSNIYSCGGGGTATATANYTCINVGKGATAIINALQENNGNQTATASSEVTANGVSEGSMSEALEAMQ